MISSSAGRIDNNNSEQYIIETVYIVLLDIPYSRIN